MNLVNSLFTTNRLPENIAWHRSTFVRHVHKHSGPTEKIDNVLKSLASIHNRNSIHFLHFANQPVVTKYCPA